MRQLVVLLLFNFLFFFVSAQENTQISVSSWVNKPEVSDFNKPLIFVDFWATWCGPCISSMPHTASLSKEFENSVLFLYISDEPSGKVKRFMEKREKSFFSAVDSSGNNISGFKVSALPHSILIDHEGAVIWKGKPNEMSKSLLSSFVNLYKSEKGAANRILKLNTSSKKISWDVFHYNLDSIHYLEVENVANEFYVNNYNEFYISGDIAFFISIINKVPISQTISNLKHNKKYTIKYKGNDIEDFNDILKRFIKKKCEINISRKKQKKRVYILEETTTENFFSSKMYNFEKGDNVYLVDDLTIIIDNATIQEMTETLSEFSEHTFLYKGFNENNYDWSIHYKYNNFTIEQLSDELSFIITEKEKKLNFYYIAD